MFILRDRFLRYYQTPKLSIINSCDAALRELFYPRKTGLLVEIDEMGMVCTAIVDGMQAKEIQQKTTSYGGLALTYFLQKLLVEKGNVKIEKNEWYYKTDGKNVVSYGLHSSASLLSFQQ